MDKTIQFIVEPESEGFIDGVIAGMNTVLLNDGRDPIQHVPTKERRANASFIHCIHKASGDETAVSLLTGIFSEHGIMPAGTSEI